ncbi:hypothetical protein MIR68_009539 [Amoeboaphelidium protococcarum]|nr:hypothetical protein MIR68_009539 [Amoeboaphelidium protococcarum]
MYVKQLLSLAMMVIDNLSLQNQYRLDFEAVTIVSGDPSSPVNTQASGTLFKDFGQDGTGAKRMSRMYLQGEKYDWHMMKQLQINDTMYVADLTVGDCEVFHLPSEEKGRLDLNLSDFKYVGREYVKRHRQTRPVQVWTWRMEKAVETELGRVLIQATYQNQPYKSQLDPRDCNVAQKTLVRNAPYRLSLKLLLLQTEITIVTDYECYVPNFDDLDDDYVFGIPSVCLNQD